MKNWLSLLFLLLTVHSVSLAQRTTGGTESGGGGGDTDALEFLSIGYSEVITELHSRSPEELDVSAETVQQKLNDLKASLDKPANAKLIFTSDTLFDSSHVEKLALFFLQSGKIYVQRRFWQRASPKEKQQIVTIELLGLSGSKHRYSAALNVTDELRARKKLRFEEPRAHLCGLEIKQDHVKFEQASYQIGSRDSNEWLGQTIDL